MSINKTSESKTYTKANISRNTLVGLFGIEFGFIDCSRNTIEKLEKAVDDKYSKQEIIDLILSEHNEHYY